MRQFLLTVVLVTAVLAGGCKDKVTKGGSKVAPSKGKQAGPPSKRSRPGRLSRKLCMKYAVKVARCAKPYLDALAERQRKLTKSAGKQTPKLKARLRDLARRLVLYSPNSLVKDCRSFDYTKAGVSCVLESPCKVVLQKGGKCARLLLPKRRPMTPKGRRAQGRGYGQGKKGGPNAVPPPKSGKGTAPPPKGGADTVPPPKSGKGTIPPPKGGAGTVPPPKGGAATVPPPKGGGATTAPPPKPSGATGSPSAKRKKAEKGAARPK